jgi:hypothetical protein
MNIHKERMKELKRQCEDSIKGALQAGRKDWEEWSVQRDYRHETPLHVNQSGTHVSLYL